MDVIACLFLAVGFGLVLDDKGLDSRLRLHTNRYLIAQLHQQQCSILARVFALLVQVAIVLTELLSFSTKQSRDPEVSGYYDQLLSSCDRKMPWLSITSSPALNQKKVLSQLLRLTSASNASRNSCQCQTANTNQQLARFSEPPLCFCKEEKWIYSETSPWICYSLFDSVSVCAVNQPGLPISSEWI